MPSDIPMPSYLETVHDDDFDVDFTRLGDIQAFSDFRGSATPYPATRHQYAEIQSKICFYPNPAIQEIHFQTTSGSLGKVLIYNTLGQVVLSSYSGNNHLDIS